MTHVWIQNGKIVNVGAWDYALAAELDNDQKPTGRKVVTNPIPSGAIETDAEVAWTADGRIVLATDYESLRAAEYPPVEEQLDALWQGGEAAADMRQKVLAVKDKYPKAQ